MNHLMVSTFVSHDLTTSSCLHGFSSIYYITYFHKLVPTSVALITSFSAFVSYLGFIFLWIEITYMINHFWRFSQLLLHYYFFPFDFHILMNLCYLKFCSEEISDALRALLEWRHNLVIWPKLLRLSIQNFISI